LAQSLTVRASYVFDQWRLGREVMGLHSKPLEFILAALAGATSVACVRTVSSTFFVSKLQVQSNARVIETTSRAPVKFVLSLKNSGYKDLRLLSVSGGCSCELKLAGPKLLHPNDQRRLEVTVSPIGFLPSVTKTVVIQTDEKDLNVHRFLVKAIFPQPHSAASTKPSIGMQGRTL